MRNIVETRDQRHRGLLRQRGDGAPPRARDRRFALRRPSQQRKRARGAGRDRSSSPSAPQLRDDGDRSPVAKLAAGSLLTLSPDSITYASIPAGGTDSGSVVEATVQPAASDPIGVPITLTLEAAAGLVDADSVQVLVGTKTGICDDFETTREELDLDRGRLRRGGRVASRGGNRSHARRRDVGVAAWARGNHRELLADAGLAAREPADPAGRRRRHAGLLAAVRQLARGRRPVGRDLDGRRGDVDAAAARCRRATRTETTGPGPRPTFVEAKVPLTGYVGVVQISFRFQLHVQRDRARVVDRRRRGHGERRVRDHRDRGDALRRHAGRGPGRGARRRGDWPTPWARRWGSTARPQRRPASAS